MRKTLSYFIITAVFFLIMPFITSSVSAATLKFDKTSFTPGNNETFQVQVIIDAGTDQVLSTDTYVLFDSTVLQAQSVAAGTYFPTVTNEVTSGKIYITGMVTDPGTSKTGSGTLATITFKAIKEATVTLTFDCRAGANDTSKIIKNEFNASNIIECSGNGTASVVVGAGGTNSPTTAPRLPTSGIMDNMFKYSVPGAILLLIGGAVRLFL